MQKQSFIVSETEKKLILNKFEHFINQQITAFKIELGDDEPFIELKYKGEPYKWFSKSLKQDFDTSVAIRLFRIFEDSGNEHKLEIQIE